MKKIILFVLIFTLSILSFSKKDKIVDDIPWSLKYSLNKYGEKDKVIEAYAGKFGLSEKISINENGIQISIYKNLYNLSDSEPVKKISFLFDSKKEIIIDSDINEIENDSIFFTGRIFLINKNHAKFNIILNEIKKSNKMSILIEDKKDGFFRITEINNKNSSKILNKFNFK